MGRHEAAEKKKIDDFNPVIILELRELAVDDVKKLATTDKKTAKAASTANGKEAERLRKLELSPEQRLSRL